MRPRVLVAILAWMVASGAAAQDLVVQFRTSPPEVEVWLLAAAQGGEEYLGVFSRPIVISNRYRVGREAVFLTFRHDGYHDRTDRVTMADLEKGRYPKAGSIWLSPRHWWVPWQPFWPIPVALSLLAVALWVVSAPRRARRRMLQALAAEGLDTGVVVGSWRLLRLLGRGGFGSVYEAISDATLDRSRPVALKLLRSDRSIALSHEIQACRSLNHPNLVPILDWGDQYLVMELVRGTSLAERVKQRPLSMEEFLAVMRGVMAALDHAHRKGVVHRDVKPQNVMLDERGRPGCNAEKMAFFQYTGQVIATT